MTEYSSDTELPPMQSARLALVNPDGLLLVLQRALTSKQGGGKWEFPGGKMDLGEDPTTAALRELREETGIELEPEDVDDPFVVIENRIITDGAHAGRRKITLGSVVLVDEECVVTALNTDEAMAAQWMGRNALISTSRTTAPTRALLRKRF